MSLIYYTFELYLLIDDENCHRFFPERLHYAASPLRLRLAEILATHAHQPNYKRIDQTWLADILSGCRCVSHRGRSSHRQLQESERTCPPTHLPTKRSIGGVLIKNVNEWDTDFHIVYLLFLIFYFIPCFFSKKFCTI